MPKGSCFMMEVATSAAVPPPMPMMPCTRPCATSSSTIAAAPLIWLLVAASRSERYFSRTTSIDSPPRAATSSVRMSPGKGGGSSMLKSSRMASWPRPSMSRLTKTMSSPRVSRLQTMTMPFLPLIFWLSIFATRRPLVLLADRGLFHLGTRQTIDHVSYRARSLEAVFVPALGHLLQHRAVHEDLLRLVGPLVRCAGVEDDAAGDIARVHRRCRIERGRAAAVDDLRSPLRIEAGGKRPPDAVPVVGGDVVVDRDHALDSVMPGSAGDHRVADVVRVSRIHLLHRHHHPEAPAGLGRSVEALDAGNLHRFQDVPQRSRAVERLDHMDVVDGLAYGGGPHDRLVAVQDALDAQYRLGIILAFVARVVTGVFPERAFPHQLVRVDIALGDDFGSGRQREPGQIGLEHRHRAPAQRARNIV